MSNREKNARELLLKLGAARTYDGFPPMTTGIALVMEDETLLQRITLRLYPLLAARYGVSVYSLQRNFKTLIEACWREENRARLLQVAGRPLKNRPRPAEFIDLLAAHLLRQEEKRKDARQQ